MRASIALILLLLSAAPVAAGEGATQEPPIVDVLPVALPVITGGKLRNYVFVSLRLHLKDGVDPTVWRDKEPYFRDAIVRAGHRTPFVLPHDWMRLDEGAVKRTMMAEAAKIAGPGVITSVDFLRGTAQKQALAPRP